MEKDFTRDSFERLLKERSDEFRMYPSNRVWNSIYNNFHPSRKWPSVVMCITLISALLMIGYLNTDIRHNTGTVVKNENKTNSQLYASNPERANANKPGSISASSNIATVKIQTSKRNTVLQPPGISNTAKAEAANKMAVLNRNKISLPNGISVANNFSPDDISTLSQLTFASTADKLESIAAHNEESTTADNSLPGVIMHIESAGGINVNTLKFKNEDTETNNETLLQKIKMQQAELMAVLNENKRTAQPENNSLTTEQKSWVENYALYNRAAAKKWKGRLSWQGYFTPSVVYRSLYNNVNRKLAADYGFTTTRSYDDASVNVNHKPSFGFEIGTGLQYDLLKWVKIRTGLQLNYTRYNIQAYKNSHPSSTTIAMVDEETGLPYEVFRSAKYSNLYGVAPAKLHNQTLQLSIPVGVDVRIGRYENVELYVASSLQPSLLLGGSSYLISSDKQNYVHENSMLNRLNMNAAFEAYVSYKTNSGYTWQLGPQYRTQLFSTNNKFYSVGEKLVNYGFKIGISKKL